MICFAKDFLRKRKKPIPLRIPSTMVLFTGSNRESIDALFDEHNRIRQLIVHTRFQPASTRKRF